MGRLSRATGKEMVRFLERRGFALRRVVGSHHVMRRGEVQTVVPVHGNENLRIGTLRGILRDIDMKPEGVRAVVAEVEIVAATLFLSPLPKSMGRALP